MDVVSLCPLQVGSLVWQPRPSLWVLTVACRATFYLLPGPARLAKVQEPVHARDQYTEGGAGQSLLCPGDLAPFKPRADVLLVGSAFAPRQEPVRSLVVRLAVGTIDKSIEVFGDRLWTREGRLAEQPFVSMPLRYERAAGGPGTSNPVGVVEPSLPNLEAPGGERREPVGFGPIAPGWPGRVERLGRHAAGWSHGAWHEQPLPEDVDRAYFNAAPRDQQLDTLRGDERITLENLHPSYPQLVTTLPGLRPHVHVRRPGAAPEDVAMTCDTLWIDTDRSLCTLTWRGRVMLEAPAQPGRVIVSTEPSSSASSGQRAALTEDVTLAPLSEQGPALPFVAGAAVSERRGPVPITPIGPATCATLAFRSQGSLRVAAIVEATFQIVPGRPMTQVEPEPTARELAPYLGRADVILHGSAHALPGRPPGPLNVRLLVARDGGQTLLSKAVTVPAAGPLPGLGPVARSAPARRALLGALDPDLFEARIVEIPDGFAWAYFHAAPEDQRIDFLRGDEWIVLEGMRPDLARMQSRLPGAAAGVRVYGPSPDPASGRPIPVVLDTLIIDAERLRCSLIWRGNVAVDDEDALGRLHVLAGVHLPERPLAFPASYPAPRAGPPSPQAALSEEMTLAPLSDLQAPATPFERAAQAGRAALSEETTLAPLPDADRRAPTMPFVAPLPGAVWSPPAQPPPRAVLSEELTLAPLPEADWRAPATPFEPPWQATPAAPTPDPPVPPAHEEPPPTPLVAQPPALDPPAPAALPEPAPAPETAAKPENKLGAQFAAAMARARELKRPR